MRFINKWKYRIDILLHRYMLLFKIVAIMILCLCLLGCWKYGNLLHSEKKQTYDLPSDQEIADSNYKYLAVTENDQISEMTGAEEVILSKDMSEYEINHGGEYHIKGYLNGTLFIRAKEEAVHLYLDNVTIKGVNGPAVFCEDAEKLIITLLPETDNTLSDSGAYKAETDAEACIYSTCNLVVNGEGSLTVNGLYKDGIRTKDAVKLLSGTYSLKCKRTGIHGNDGILITGGTYTIASEKNGLRTIKAGRSGRGDLIIHNCEMSVIAGRYCFNVTKGNLLVYDCTIHQKGIAGDYTVGGRARIQEGCLH